MSEVFKNISFHELIPLLLFFGGIPVFDTAFAFLRRVIRKKSPFSPDRAHLHHRLMDMKLSISLVVISMVALQALSLYIGVEIFVRIR
jgi:UDP-GlcNAc:undecaprenyl-phosphate GlcNAc-1-phosphate transferase